MKKGLLRLTRLALTTLAAFGLVAFSPASLDAQELDEAEMSNDASSALIETLRAEDLTVFAQLVQASGLSASFASDEPLTLFVPTNAAFADVPEDAVQGADRARAVVSYLTVKGQVVTPEDAAREQVESIDPLVAVRSISVTRDDDGRIVVADPDESAHVVDTFRVGNHVIHAIDGVLLPSAEAMN